MSTTPFTPPTIETYLSLITSEHNQQPDFMATVAAEIQPFVDIQATLYSMIGMFSPSSVGVQLDAVGVWVGANRSVKEPITNAYFAWDTPGVGWDQGTWYAIGDPTNGITVLSDSAFQILIKFIIAQNSWDGTVPGAYKAFATAFDSEGYRLLIQDNQNGTMDIVICGMLDAVTLALVTGGYFNMRPAGVLITTFYCTGVDNAPAFWWGADGPGAAGWGTGVFIQPIS